MKTYLMDPQKRAIYEEELQTIRDEHRIRPVRELNRDECISSVRLLEQAKIDAQIKMYDYVRTQKIQHAMINAVIKVEKLKADDKFFIETGIEEEDVEPSIKRLNLEEDDEYKQIVEEFKKKSEDFLNEKQEEARIMMEKAAREHKEREAAKEQETAEAEEPKDKKDEVKDPMSNVGADANIW